jgi:hypothetical protein
MLFSLQERIPMEEVFEQLKCTREGLSADEGASRLQVFGPNKLEEKKVSFVTFYSLLNKKMEEHINKSVSYLILLSFLLNLRFGV